MKRLSLLLLDANVVIYLFEIGIWAKVVELCDLHLARTVVDEANFFEDERGQRQDFDLGPYIDRHEITVFDVMPSDMDAFFEQFDVSYLEKLDDGEAESLAHMLKAPEEMLFCSADKIVFRVLGNLDRSTQGISLEEVLAKIGHSRSLPQQFGKAYRARWTRFGVEERMRGLGTKTR